MQRLSFHQTSLSLAVLAFAVTMFSARTASADEVLFWNNASGGSASNAVNWNPSFVPLANDDLRFNLDATYEVTFDDLVQQVRSHSYRAGNVTLRMLSPHFNLFGQGGFAVGHLTGNDATVTLAEGRINWENAVTVGSFVDSVGRFYIDGPTATLNIDPTLLFVGSAGRGEVQVTDGGSVNSQNGLRIASNAGSIGSVYVNQLPNLPMSVLTVPAGDVVVGELGTGSLEVGGQATFGQSVFVAEQPGSEGALFFDARSVNTSLDIVEDLYLGHNPAGAAGDGVFNAFHGIEPAVMTIGRDVFIGDPDGGTGTFELYNVNTTVHVLGNFISDPSNAILELFEGTLIVEGRFIPPAGTFTLNGFGPRLELRGGTALFEENAIIGAEFIGELLLTRGADVSFALDGANLGIGNDNTGVGTLTMRDHGTRLSMPLGTVRNVQGHASVNISGGAVLDCTVTNLGMNRNTYAAVIDGAGSEWNMARHIVVGGSAGQPGGSDGTLDVVNGGVLSAADPGATSFVYSGGVLTVADSGEANLAGRLQVRGGELNVHRGTMRVENGVDLFSGRVRASSVIVGDLEITAATLEPRTGASQIGIMSVEGNVNTDSDLASFEIQIGGLEPGDQHDQLAVTGSVHLHGTLVLRSFQEFEPQRNDEFVIVTGNGVSGRFSSVDEDSVWSSLCYDIIYEERQVRIVVIGRGDGAALESVTVSRGVILNGGLDEVTWLDDEYLHTRSGFGTTLVDLHSTVINVSVIAEDPLDEFIDIFVEERIDQPSGISKLRVRDVGTGQLVQVASFGLNATDRRHDRQSLDADRFMTPEGRIEIQIEHDVFVPFLAFTFQSFVDQVKVCTM